MLKRRKLKLLKHTLALSSRAARLLTLGEDELRGTD